MANKQTGNPVGVGLAGAALGVAIGASAVALSDKKTRKIALDKMNTLKTQAKDVVAKINLKKYGVKTVGKTTTAPKSKTKKVS